MIDKVQKIKEWIKEKIACWCNESQCEVPELPKQIIEGKILALREMLSFIDTLQEEPVAPKVLEDMLNAKTAAESLGISAEEHDRIVDELIYGKEPEMVDIDDLPKEEPVSKEIGDYDHKAVMESLHPELKEEPVSIWHDASENPKEEEYLMCVYKDNRYHIGKVYKDEFDRLLVSDNKNIIELCMFEKWAYIEDLLNLSNVEQTVKDLKEPVSEDLEDAAKYYIPDESYHMIIESKEEGSGENVYDYIQMIDMFKAGAKWQRGKMIAMAIDGTARPDDNEIWCNLASSNLKDGDKVKVIVIKED